MKQHIFIRCGKISMAASGGMIVANYFLGSMKPLTCGSGFREGQIKFPCYYIITGNRT